MLNVWSTVLTFVKAQNHVFGVFPENRSDLDICKVFGGLVPPLMPAARQPPVISVKPVGQLHWPSVTPPLAGTLI